MTLGSPISEVWENFTPTFAHENFTNYNQIEQNNTDILNPKNDYEVPKQPEPPAEKKVEEPKPEVVNNLPEKPEVPAISEQQNQINEEIFKHIKSLENKIVELIEQNKNGGVRQVDLFGKNIHDILLFIILGIFILLVLDSIFRILKMKLNKNV